MGVKLHAAGEGHAKTLIAAGKYDVDSSWSFSAADGNELLGGENGQNWTADGNMHLGEDTSAADQSAERFKHPFGKGGKVYLSALSALAAQEGEVGAAAKRLKALIKENENVRALTATSKLTWCRMIKAEAATNGNPIKPTQILVYDEIRGGADVEAFQRALMALDANEIEMRINSP